ncbi:MAG: outer membrane protein assembly factor BamD [Proteobacteria bacterium]|nr:outer membrane protein assembly factor BamD [Pseudomonadota bacterium]
MKSRFITAIFALCAISALACGCGKEKVMVGEGEPGAAISKCLSLSSRGKHEDAIQCLEMFKARYPNTREAQEAELLIGDSYFARKDYLLAAESYAAFIKLYPLHPKADYAHYRIGVCYYKEAPKAIDRDQKYLEDAIIHLKAAARGYPGSDYREAAIATLKAARNRLARRQFYVGRFYYRTGEYKACLGRFDEVAEIYPESGLADRALYHMVEANLGLGNIAAARDSYGKLVSRYPDSSYTKRAERKMLSAVSKKS